jgi:sugar phosphate isomerase/epimerase
MLALSTAWKVRELARGEDVVREARRCGFDALEITHGLTRMKVEQLLDQVQAGQIGVVSLHNFVPAVSQAGPGGSDPDHYSLASADAEERRLAVEHTRETIDWAVAFGARAVVLHCGKVPMADPGARLMELHDAGRGASAEFAALRDEARRARAAAARPLVEGLKRSLDELNRYADGRGIALGLENRYNLGEFPDRDELIELNETFAGGAIGYWHDVGHAQCHEVLGLTTQEELLEPLARFLVGVHLHDALGRHDHRVPGRGAFDFRRLRPYLRRDTLRVIEASEPATSEQLVEGRQLIVSILGD